MACLESLKYEIIMKDFSFQEAAQYIKKHYKTYCEVKPGEKVLGIPLIGRSPIFVAVEGDEIVFPYTKPCRGTFLLKVRDAEEAARLRKMC